MIQQLPISRRGFLACTAACAATAGRASAHTAPGRRAEYLTAASATAPLSQMGEFGRRAPFGWQVGGIPPSSQLGELELQWRAAAPPPDVGSLRLCVLDTREPHTPVEARLGESGRVLGQFDLRWVADFQLFQIRLNAGDIEAALREGVRLRQTGGTLPVWILTGSGSGPELPNALRPHLLIDSPTDPMAEFFARMDSLACVQAFGWMGGCVLDGLRDLAALPRHRYLQRSLREHLARWFKPDGSLVYENLRGEAADNRISGIGSTLPFAALAWEQPNHTAMQLAIQFWRERETHDPEGCIIDRTTTNSEGAYTVGYPLAVVARQRRDLALARSALKQVMVRQERLFDGQAFFRTYARKANGRVSRGDRNWCRGIAWQFLGLTRTVAALEGVLDLACARAEVARLAEWVTPYQLPSGLWSVFVDEPELHPDTSGSAGIAAALALGVKHGWLSDTARAAAARCLAGLKRHLTPDGFLGGASQSNKGGQGLQRSDYRVIYQMGMGLMAQLIAALDWEKNP
ncbi:MAG: glycoside hydrolase family 88 protein [Planctomycetota bacterium]